ncbi:MAG: helix-turn-helix transcriptional regulator [Actinomycetota bacterium]
MALRDARARQRLSQQEVAERAGIQRYQVANLELGKGNPSLKTLLAVLSAVGLELHVNADGLINPAGPTRNLAKSVSLNDVLSRARK